MFGRQKPTPPIFTRHPQSGDAPRLAPGFDPSSVSLDLLADHCAARKAEIKRLTEELEPCETALKARATPGEKITTPSGAVVQVVESQAVEITDPEKLKDLLGEEAFCALTRADVKYRAEPGLNDLACDADSPVGEKLREGVFVRTTIRVRYTPPKAR
jgi:hypothetical protein